MEKLIQKVNSLKEGGDFMKSWERCYVEFLVRIAEPLGELPEGYFVRIL